MVLRIHSYLLVTALIPNRNLN